MYGIDEKMGLTIQPDLISLGKADKYNKHNTPDYQPRRVESVNKGRARQAEGVRSRSQRGLLLRLVSIILSL